MENGEKMVRDGRKGKEMVIITNFQQGGQLHREFQSEFFSKFDELLIEVVHLPVITHENLFAI